jgi:hypothetical protein
MKAAYIVRALGGSKGMARCPAHNERTGSLSVSDGRDGKILVHCFGGCGQREVIHALRQRDLWPGNAGEPPLMSEAERERRRRQEAERRRHEEAARARKQARALRIWESGIPAAPQIAKWIDHRGINRAKLELDRLPLRWVEQCPRGEGTAPAMVALMTDPVTGEPCGIHRTYLLPDGSGKAFGKDSRKMLGPRGVIRLSPDDEVELGLGICEGIETGLAIMASGFRPVWACGSLPALTAFPVLSGIEALTVFADGKPHEVEGAKACAKRWDAAGREARVFVPPAGGDFNDVLRVLG